MKASSISDVCEDLATDEEKNVWRLGSSKPFFCCFIVKLKHLKPAMQCTCRKLCHEIVELKLRTATGAGALNTYLMKTPSEGDARKSLLSFSVFLYSFYCSLNGL